LFAVLCGFSSLRYVWLNMTGDASLAPWTQFLCFALTAGSLTYFFRPRVGFFAMLAITLLVLFVEAPAGPLAAVAFWLGVLALLLLPYAAALLRRPLIRR
jgi:hypothetical protein